jgi:alpha-mannosidase
MRHANICHLQIKDVVEVSLSANQKKSDMKKLEWTVEGNEEIQKDILRGSPMRKDDTNVEIAPMEIRSFLITL